MHSQIHHVNMINNMNEILRSYKLKEDVTMRNSFLFIIIFIVDHSMLTHHGYMLIFFIRDRCFMIKRNVKLCVI